MNKRLKKIFFTIVIGCLAFLAIILSKIIINNSFISKGSNGNQEYKLVLLSFLNFYEPYVLHYNYGNYYYKQELYEEAKDKYEEALQYKIPKEKVCDVEINLSLSLIKLSNQTKKNKERIAYLTEAKEHLAKCMNLEIDIPNDISNKDEENKSKNEKEDKKDGNNKDTDETENGKSKDSEKSDKDKKPKDKEEKGNEENDKSINDELSEDNKKDGNSNSDEVEKSEDGGKDLNKDLDGDETDESTNQNVSDGGDDASSDDGASMDGKHSGQAPQGGGEGDDIKKGYGSIPGVGEGAANEKGQMYNSLQNNRNGKTMKEKQQEAKELDDIISMTLNELLNTFQGSSNSSDTLSDKEWKQLVDLTRDAIQIAENSRVSPPFVGGQAPGNDGTPSDPIGNQEGSEEVIERAKGLDSW